MGGRGRPCQCCSSRPAIQNAAMQPQCIAQPHSQLGGHQPLSLTIHIASPTTCTPNLHQPRQPCCIAHTHPQLGAQAPPHRRRLVAMSYPGQCIHRFPIDHDVQPLQVGLPARRWVAAAVCAERLVLVGDGRQPPPPLMSQAQERQRIDNVAATLPGQLSAAQQGGRGSRPSAALLGFASKQQQHCHCKYLLQTETALPLPLLACTRPLRSRRRHSRC